MTPILHAVAFSILAMITLAGAAKAREPFYQTPVPDEETRLLAMNPNDEVYELYSESHALLIGLSKYSTFKPDLPGVKTEVARLADTLHAHRFKVEVHFDLTGDELVSTIHNFMRRRATTPNSRILVYVSGHGEQVLINRYFGYLIPVDAPSEQDGKNAVLAASLPMSLFAAWAQIPAARHMLFVFDACFSGSFFGRSDGPLPPGPLYNLASEPLYKKPTTAAATPQARTPVAAAPPKARGPEAGDYIFQASPRSLGRQFLTAGGSSETVPANSVFSDLFIRILSGGMTSQAQSNFDHWTTGREIGTWLELNGRSAYMTPQGAASPVYGSLPDNLFQAGDIVFTRLDVDNPFIVKEKEDVVPFPEPEAVSKAVRAEMLVANLSVAPSAAVNAAYAEAIEQSRAAGRAAGVANRLEHEAKSVKGPPSASETVMTARLKADQALNAANRALSALQDRVAELAAPPSNLTTITLEVAAAGGRAAAVAAPSDLSSAILSSEEEATLQKIVDDLSSDNAEVRREARGRLTRFLSEATPPKSKATTARLLRDLSHKSYRFQIGLAAALAKFPREILTDDARAARAEVERALAAPAGRDPTLRENLSQALAKMPESKPL